MEDITIQQIITKMSNTDWVNKPLGYFRTKVKGVNTIKSKKGFEIFIRDRKFDEFLKNSSNTISINPYGCKLSGTGSTSPMGGPKRSLTPGQTFSQIACANNQSLNLPALADFSSYPSLMAIRPDKPCILIGYDSEWENLNCGGRDMLSWQFAVVHDGRMIEMCFIKTGDESLSLDSALSFILDYLDVPSVDKRSIRRYEYCYGWDSENKPLLGVTDDLKKAWQECVYAYLGFSERGKTVNEDGNIIDDVDGWTHYDVKSSPLRKLSRKDRGWGWFHSYLDFSSVDSVNVCLLCHTGLVDISGFGDTEYLLKHLTEVQGGLVSLTPIRLAPKSFKNVNNDSVYPISLSIADTMCHAPAGMKKLKDLGTVVGINKVNIPASQKSHMLKLLVSDPVTFMEYASTDSVVTLCYASALYDYNNTPPVTVTSAAASVMKGTMMKYLNVDNTEDFNRVYRGLERVSHGKFKLDDRPGYVEAKSLEPISDKANSVQHYASQAYHGGYNSCSEVGYFPDETYDYDLQNAYPTAMCLVPDVDWDDPIRVQVQNRNMTLQDFLMFGNKFNPIVPFVGYCRFKFPDDVKYPCIPVNVDGVPIYPKSSDGLNGVYVAGPYIYLALRLGAEVYCENGYFLNVKLTDDLNESRSLSAAVLQLVRDRRKAKLDHGKKSLEELILKMLVNSGYGKGAQNVVQKQSWTALRDVMDVLGCSCITNPVSAMMVTSIVQCELLAAQNQMHAAGYIACSVTTDGFISNCPEDILKTLDLYGFRPFMEHARLFLTDGADSELWEAKHHQNDLVNFTTRGNISLLPHGVCAHNSAKSGYVSDSYDDRLWLMTKVLSRTGTVDCVDNKWSSFKDIARGKTDFKVTKRIRHLHMDFDLKRKPDRSSFYTDYPVINGVRYEIAHFDTTPYNTVEEFMLYRKKKELCDCLRTKGEWDLFFVKVDTNACGMNVKDLNWSILMSVIMGYRSQLWDIPALNGLSVSDKCAWINSHNDSKRLFKESDWKNSRRPERQVNILPKSFIKDKLIEMQTAK